LIEVSQLQLRLQLQF